MPPKSSGGPGGNPGAQKAKLQHRRSDVQPIAGNRLLGNFYIWTSECPAVKEDPDLMFGKCLVVQGTTETVFKIKQIEPKRLDEELEIKSTDAFNTNDSSLDILAIHDISSLSHQNVAAVLDFLRQRWLAKSIYTTADPLLIAINPFRDVGLTTEAVVTSYRDAVDTQRLPPHVFKLARECLENYHAIEKSQTIIVTGESGAGKTEATKHVMRFFASCKGGIADARIQNAVMAANPVLEAFGNAKTVRNNNSSRFGRFMQLKIGKGGGIQFGTVLAFLLEKVRVVSQEPSERSYHIFYQMSKCASAELREQLDLMQPQDYRCLTLKSGGCFDAPGIDDADEWRQVLESFTSMQMTDSETTHILLVVSAIMMLCNSEFNGVTIDGQDNAAQFTPDGAQALARACRLLQIDAEKTASELCSTVVKIGTESVTKRLQVPGAQIILDSLAKALYEKLFLWIIDKLNVNIAPPDGFSAYVGMLDIFGFEVFDTNSLEQLLINITNEFLQKNFVEIVFEKEQKLYKDEGIPTAELKYTSNQGIIDLLIGKSSIFSCLEDACLAPGGSDESLVNSLNRQFGSNACYQQFSRGLKPTFIVKHSVADIPYVAVGFLEKNKDQLKSELVEIVKASGSPVAKELFASVVSEKGKLAKGQLIASQFVRSLKSLMSLILSTESHFVRCVKPNETKKPADWDNSKVLNQLFSLSVLEALQLKQIGFAYRRPFADFVKQFRYLDLAGANSDEDRVEVAQKILKSAAIAPADFAIGKSMIFMKPDASRALAHKQREKLAEWKSTLKVVEAFIWYKRRKEEVKTVRPSAVRVQASSRWFVKVGHLGASRQNDIAAALAVVVARQPIANSAGAATKDGSRSRRAAKSRSLLAIDPWFDQFGGGGMSACST